jgi:hypothetical protein
LLAELGSPSPRESIENLIIHLSEESGSDGGFNIFCNCPGAVRYSIDRDNHTKGGGEGLRISLTALKIPSYPGAVGSLRMLFVLSYRNQGVRWNNKTVASLYSVFSVRCLPFETD